MRKVRASARTSFYPCRAQASDTTCKPGWELVFRCNPPRSLLPRGVPKNTPAHMFGPDVLLAGWPETSANCG